jgi:hypothetical protein
MNKLLFATVSLVAVGSLAGNVLLYKRYSTQRPIMQLGDDAISKKDYLDSLDFQFGKQVLTKMAFKKLVINAATKAKVLPTDSDIEAQIKDINRVSPHVLTKAQQAGRMDEFKDDLRTQMALDNLRIKDVKSSESEINGFYQKNRAQFVLPAQDKTTLAIAQDPVNAQTAAQMLRDKISKEIMSQRQGIRLVGPTFQPNWSALPKATTRTLSQGVHDTPLGGVRIIPIKDGAQTIYFIARVDSRTPSGAPSLGELKPKLDRIVRLNKAPSPQSVLAKLYRDANVRFEVDRYASYFTEISSYTEQAVAKNQ